MRTLYVFEGDGIVVGGTEVGARTGAVVRSDVEAELESPAGAEVLLLQGRPIGEPVARYGPFVMNEEREIEEAFADYRETGFGGWPWPSEEPVHHGSSARFALRPDGVREEPAETSAHLRPLGQPSVERGDEALVDPVARHAVALKAHRGLVHRHGLVLGGVHRDREPRLGAGDVDHAPVARAQGEPERGRAAILGDRQRSLGGCDVRVAGRRPHEAVHGRRAIVLEDLEHVEGPAVAQEAGDPVPLVQAGPVPEPP